MKRRTLLQSFAATAATPLLPAWALQPVEPLLKRRIPSSGAELPVIGLGTSGAFEVGDAAAEREPLAAVLDELLKQAGSVVDTAPSYGSAEAVLGSLLAARAQRERCFLATKISSYAPQAAKAQWQSSLARLRTDKVELLQVHSLVDLQSNLRFLRELQQAGKTRYIGVTHYRDEAHEELVDVVRTEKLDFVQINYSVVSRSAERELLPLCADRGVAVLVNRAFEDGRLFAQVKGRPLPGWAGEIDCASWGQLMLKFVLAQPAVTCVIPATSKPRNLLDNLGAGRGRLPDAKQAQRIAALF
jgi:aryl-alcohol dehydrogenase-like predicted oxidoreductase